MSAPKPAGPVPSPSLAEKKSELLTEALGDDFSVEVLDDETVEIVAKGRSVCTISFEDETARPKKRLRSRS